LGSKALHSREHLLFADQKASAIQKPCCIAEQPERALTIPHEKSHPREEVALPYLSDSYNNNKQILFQEVSSLAEYFARNS
jgi:hypothetical protein